MLGVPVNDDSGEQVQPGHPEMLSFSCSVANFTLATNAQGILEGVMSFALVQTYLRATLHVDVQQPVDHKQCPFNPSDFT